MHVYTKKYVDGLLHKAVYLKPNLCVQKLDDIDIAEYKKDFNEDKFDTYITNKYGYEPSQKSIRQKIIAENKRKALEKEQKIKEKKQLKEKEKEKAKEKEKIKEKEKAKEKDKSKETEEEKVPEILKLVLSREGETDTFKSQFKTSVSSEKENSSINADTTVPDIISGHLKAKEPVQENKYGKIRVRSAESLFPDGAAIQRFKLMFLSDISNTTATSSSNRTVSCFNRTVSNPNRTVSSTIANGPAEKVVLKDVENLYNKYFSKSVQDTIVVIANILNMISMSNKHHKARMDESFKKKTEAEKLKERCDANRLHVRHKKVLETKLKAAFEDVTKTFDDSEFEPTFRMFFLSILTVLRVLDQPKFKKGSIFKNLILLLWNSLKNSNFDHPKVFGLFRSKSFRPDCIDLISLIEDSRDNDPGVTDRMALFFVSTVNSREHFQSVIDAVTSDSNEDLGLLIDHASFQCRLNSRFKDPELLGNSLPTAIGGQTIQQSTNGLKLVKNNDAVHKWVLTKTPNGTYQPLNLPEKTSQKSTLIAQASLGHLQPITTIYEPYSNSMKTTMQSIQNKVLAPKINFTTTSTISNGSSGSTIVLKPALRHISAASLQTTPDYNTIYVGNKQYQLVRGASGQMKAVAASNHQSVVIRAGMAPPTPSVDTSVKCFARNCRNPATIMCSTCAVVKYCSHACQRKDWYDSHIHNCALLRTNRQN